MTIGPATKAAQFRDLLHRPRIARLVGARDGLTSLLVEEAGFDGIWVSSFELSATQGLPDLSLLTMSEILDGAATVERSTRLPVLADCDTGFGSAINLARTVQRFEAAGIAGICIEDKVFPKRNSFLDGDQLLQDPDEFARSIEAGVRIRNDSDFTLVARCEALIAGRSMDEAVQRMHTYVDAGADAVLIHSKRPDPDEVIEFTRRWQQRTPVIVVPTTYHRWSAIEAERCGVSMVIYANQTLRATVYAVRSVLNEIYERGETTTVEGSIATVKDIFTITSTFEWEERSA